MAILRRNGTQTITLPEGGPAKGTVGVSLNGTAQQMGVGSPETVVQDYRVVVIDPAGLLTIPSMLVTQDPTLDAFVYYTLSYNIENVPNFTRDVEIPSGSGAVNLATLPPLSVRPSMYRGIWDVIGLNAVTVNQSGATLYIDVPGTATTPESQGGIGALTPGTAVNNQAALEALVASIGNGGTISLRGLYYGLTAKLLIQNKTIHWDGGGGGLVQLGDPEYVGGLVEYSNSDGSTIRDLQIHGNEDDDSWSAGPRRVGLYLQSSNNCVIDNVQIYRKTYGIYVEDSFYCAFSGIYFSGLMEGHLLSGANFHSGIRIDEGGFHQVNGLVALHTGSGLSVVGGTTTNLLITNVHVDEFYDNGIYVSGGQKCEITNARIYGRGYGTGIKTRGDYHRVTNAYVENTIAGFACSGIGALGGGVYQGVGEYTHIHNGVTKVYKYVGRGMSFDNITAVHCKAGGFEIQNRPYNVGGDQAFPYDCRLSNARFIDVCYFNTDNYGVLIRGVEMTVHNVSVIDYAGNSLAFRAQGNAVDEHVPGYKISDVRVINSNSAGIQMLYLDDSVLENCMVENIAVAGIAFYVANCDNCRLAGNTGQNGVSAVAFKGMFVNAASLNNWIYDNKVSAMNVDRVLNPNVYNNLVNNQLEDGRLKLSNRLLQAAPEADFRRTEGLYLTTSNQNIINLTAETGKVALVRKIWVRNQVIGAGSLARLVMSIGSSSSANNIYSNYPVQAGETLEIGDGSDYLFMIPSGAGGVLQARASILNTLAIQVEYVLLPDDGTFFKGGGVVLTQAGQNVVDMTVGLVGTQAEILGIWLSNITGIPASCTVAVGSQSDAAHMIYRDVVLASGETRRLKGPITLNAAGGQVIQAKAGADNSINMMVFYGKRTRYL